MGKGQFFTPHQRAIVDRYYEHLDTIVIQKLAETVSDLYVCESPSAAEKLWASAAKVLAKTPADPARAAEIVRNKDVVALATLVGEITAAKPGTIAAKTPPPSAAGTPPAAAAPLSPVAAAPKPASASPASAANPPASPTAAPSSDTLKSALKAFRKRIKLTRLDEESKIGRNPLTSGSHSAVVAIIPPRQFPREVWEELARQGKLKSSGQGFYALVEPEA